MGEGYCLIFEINFSQGNGYVGKSANFKVIHICLAILALQFTTYKILSTLLLISKPQFPYL